MEKQVNDFVIDDSNFSEYFFDIRKNKPQHGQIMAKFSAIAEFVEGQGKKDIISLLKIGKVHQAVMVMRKIHGAKEPDCYRICREICEDLLTLSDNEVEQKKYEYIMEMFFYTQKEFIPNNDPHWQPIKLLNSNYNCDNFVLKH